MDTLMFIMSLVSIISAIAAWVMLYIDHRLSINDVYYGLTEGNKVWRDKYWFYNYRKGLFVLVLLIPVFSIALIVLGVYFSEALPWAFLFFAPMTSIENFVIQRKLKNRKFMVNKQVKVLEDIMENPKDYMNYPKLTRVIRNGRDFLYLFPWIYTASDGNDNSVLLQQMLVSEMMSSTSPSAYLNSVISNKRYHAEL